MVSFAILSTASVRPSLSFAVGLRPMVDRGRGFPVRIIAHRWQRGRAALWPQSCYIRVGFNPTLSLNPTLCCHTLGSEDDSALSSACAEANQPPVHTRET